MKNIILFDDCRVQLLPLTYTRPVAELRVGITTISEKWQHFMGGKISFHTENYLSAKFPLCVEDDNYLINGSIIPDAALVSAIGKLQTGEMLVKANTIIACRLDKAFAGTFSNQIAEAGKTTQYSGEYLQVKNSWDIFELNDKVIRADFQLITAGRKSLPISKTNNVISPENIFIEEGAKVECAFLNAATGPIYIGKDAEIMEGCMVRGSLALCDHSALKMGAKIYGATTIGPGSKVGGEVHNSVFTANSNKAHDGFLGNSVLGEWCNLGADTNNSNLKNNYAEVKLWSYATERFANTGLQFCGLIMGDHSKCGINTMFNTGTVVGVSANIFGAGYPRNFIPSFTWGGAQGLDTYPLNKAIETAQKVFGRRKKEFSEVEQKIFEQIFIQSEKFRR